MTTAKRNWKQNTKGHYKLPVWRGIRLKNNKWRSPVGDSAEITSTSKKERKKKTTTHILDQSLQGVSDVTPVPKLLTLPISSPFHDFYIRLDKLN